jgi:type VI secretion system FHA domain protein
MGDYQFEVSIVNVSRDGADDRGDAAPSDEEKAAEAVSRARAARAAKAASSAGPASLKLLAEEADEMASDAELAAAEHHPTDTVTYPDGEPSEQALNSTFAETGVIDEDFFRGETAAPERQPEPEPERGPLRQPAATGGDLSEAVRLLMEASGLDASRLPAGSEHETLVTIGHLVRATVEGLLSVLRSRALIKGQFRLTQTTIQAGDNNPLKFVPGAQDALEQLFYRPTTEFLRPVEAVDDAFRDVRAHQVATVVAMKAAFHDLLERLEPDLLENRFDRGLKRGGLFPGGKQAKYWELYRDLFQVIAGHTDENFANIVGPKFAEAYDREIYRLTGRGLPPRRIVDS